MMLLSDVIWRCLLRLVNNLSSTIEKTCLDEQVDPDSLCKAIAM